MDYLGQQLENFIKKTLGIDVTVVLGGSHALQEAAAMSDRDYYLITQHLWDLIRLLHEKKRIRSFINAYTTEIQLIPATESMLRHGWVYMYGHDLNGRLRISKNDLCHLQLSFLKVAYQEYIAAVLDSTHMAYHLSKACIFVLSTIGIVERHSLLMTPPFVSMKKVQQALDSLVVGNKERCHKIIGYKQEEAPIVVDEDIRAVRQLLERAYRNTRNIFSWRSWVLYNGFGVFHGKVHFLFRNPDRYIIDRLRNLANYPQAVRFEMIRKDVNRLFIF